MTALLSVLSMIIAHYGTRNYRKTQEETKLFNHVLNKKACTRLTDYCKRSPDISLASSSIAINIDRRTEYALGSHHLPFVQSITCELIAHTTPRRRADRTSFKDAELKPKKQQRPTNVYHAENTLRKCSGWQAYTAGKIKWLPVFPAKQ